MIVMLGRILEWVSSMSMRFRNKYKVSQFAAHGLNVRIEGACDIAASNVYCGDHVYIGPNARFLSSDAKIYIGNHVMFGPNVMMATGNHRVDVVGRFMSDVKEKLPENDADIVIEDDCWIGMGAIILKGVTIGRGSVIGAGTIVTKDIPPYSLVHSHSQLIIKERFNKEQVLEHEKALCGKKENE